MYPTCLALLVLFATFGTATAVVVEPLPPQVPAALADAAVVLSPSAVHVDGWLEARIDANVSHRLLVVDTVPMLSGYHKRPGSQPAKEDWFAVHLHAPITFSRVVFAHGKTFHDGGWFDCSSGKPQVQIRR